ncbi:MAG: type II secretion system F family protein [Actinomycetota bacterium]
MNLLPIILGAVLGAAGVTVLVRATAKPLVSLEAVLADLEGGPHLDEFSERVATPFVPRLLRPAGTRAVGLVRALLPSNYLDRIRRKLVVAGLTNRVTAEEFVAIQLVSVFGCALLGMVLTLLKGWSAQGILRAMVVLAVLGALGPIQWLQKSREKRQGLIRRDLPDILDLLAISVEAGVGLEGAIEVVGKHFDTPLAVEMGRMLREMELGVPRRTALQNLKARVDVHEVSNFVMSMVQADALGMPIGRVLRTQATEMRIRRRQWAREKAGKLPVKIIFPLVTFILPALFVVVLGPAVISIMHNIIHK